jgi:hypothetical protein
MGTARRVRLGTWARPGPTAAAAAAPLGLLVASRSSPLRMAMVEGSFSAQAPQRT